MPGPSTIFTIGYEGLVQPQLIDLLRAAKIEKILDVRAIASSRKAGFSKTLLAASLNAAGIAYRHDRRLGTPKPGRQAARAGKSAEMAHIFSAHMKTEDALTALTQATAEAATSITCLLCFEKAPHACHRSIIATMIRQKTAQNINHL